MEGFGFIPPERFAETVADWQRLFVLLGGRSNLLYFRPGKTAVHIVEQIPDGIMERADIRSVTQLFAQKA